MQTVAILGTLRWQRIGLKSNALPDRQSGWGGVSQGLRILAKARVRMAR